MRAFRDNSSVLAILPEYILFPILVGRIEACQLDYVRIHPQYQFNIRFTVQGGLSFPEYAWVSALLIKCLSPFLISLPAKEA